MSVEYPVYKVVLASNDWRIVSAQQTLGVNVRSFQTCRIFSNIVVCSWKSRKHIYGHFGLVLLKKV